jgi:hypothetical protein
MYSITVKIDDIEKRRRSAGLLHIVMGFFLIAKAADYYKHLGYKNFLPVIPVLLIAPFSLFYGLFRKKLDPSAQYNNWLRVLQAICFTVLGFLFINSENKIDYIVAFIFGFISLFLFFSERSIFNETTIFFDENGISIPGYYKEHLVKWEELEDVKLREDFITIFHAKQKYLQYQVMQDLSTLEVAKLNAFCREKIEQRQKA